MLRYNVQGHGVSGVINFWFAGVRECVSRRHFLDRKQAVMSPSAASKPAVPTAVFAGERE